MSKYTIGLDYGTESARAVLVDVESGQTIAGAVQRYPHGVIDRTLPGSNTPLPTDWALQHPADWLTVLEATVPKIIAEAGVDPAAVIGLGLDFTACTLLPTTPDGTPLSELTAYCTNPHAWTKLWKHHAAQPQANRINQLARQQNVPWLPRYGGKISSEWLLPKALQILEEAPDIYAAATCFVEGSDWVTWQLTGQLTRNACAAGYKGTWHKTDGLPKAEFLAQLHPDFGSLYQSKYPGQVVAPGTRVGGLTATWAARLGLTEETAVAAPIIDAHAAAIGGGITQPGIMFMIMGTSTCHLLMTHEEVLVEGISGVVEDGIVPGLFGYEAGQAGVGDIFGWFVEHAVPPAYYVEAEAQALSLHEILTQKAAQLRPGESGLLALDWWNGCRTTLVDAELSGLIIGATLATRAEEIYRALIEATALGTRLIIEAFTEQGAPIEAIVTGGGLTQNALLMQIYADVTGREMTVTGTEQASAQGAAILGAVAAGQKAGGYQTIGEAALRMAPSPAQTYTPNLDSQATYDTLYAEYRRLYNYFGRGENNVMKTLRRLQETSSGFRV